MATHGHDRPLDEREEALMRAFLPALREVQRRVDQDLVADQDMSLTEYLVLMHLSEAPERRIGLSELSTLCNQSLSAVSRTVGRLEAGHLVERVRSSRGNRSSDAVLTDRGLRRLKAAWPTHLASVRRNFLDHLEGLDLEALAQALQRVAAPPG